MEILILGVVLVALMVYVSTRIKKSAASAFEREIIEKENFRLIKPDGFISPINENSDFPFEAYTKEFGKNEADEFRQAQANLVVISGSNFDSAIENISKNGEKVLAKSFSTSSADEQRTCLIESEKIEKNINLKVFYKVIESRKNRKVYNLRVSILDSYLEEYKTKTNEMLQSFVVE